MATFFHGNSEIQGDGLQRLILMNPSYVGYSDPHHQPPAPNFAFLNSATTAGNSIHPQNLNHAPPTQSQQLVSFPLQASTSAAGSASPHDPDHPSVHSQPDISAFHGLIPRVHYDTCSSIDPTVAREMARAQQGLTLSLSSQQTVHRAPQTVPPASGGDDVGVSSRLPSSATGISNGVNGVQRSLLSSKYLKAAQELLDEVVNVGKGVKNELGKRKAKTTGQLYESSAVAGEGLNGGRTSVKGGGELTMERQEIQMKKAKLFSMLEEVQERYMQYHNQMDMVICWFEQGAGIGSAKRYTALALETISRQFRCLKDAIRGQIRAASKNLGKEESFRGRTSEVSRLKLVDNNLRLQQRALQHLGTIQPNAWRPQRGLPERSVSVLRAWLFEHFLHPYPKDSDKVMLAKQTGLTRSQVSNWFINARVRLWKPMVEEMYLEETKEQEQINGSEDKTNEDSQIKSNTQQQINPTPPNISVNTGNQTESLIPQGIGPKKQRTLETLLPPNANHVHLTIFNGGFGSLTQIGEIGRFGSNQFPATYSGNNGTVSLTLGLPHRENLSISGTHQSFLPNPLGGRVEIGEPNDQFGCLNTPATSSQSTAVYDQDIDLRNQKRFAAQLLPDFVA